MFIRNGNCINTFKFNIVCSLIFKLLLGVSKKIKKPIKPRKPKKNNRKNRLKFWKNRPVRFSFISKKTNWTKPKPKKTEPNRKNRAKPVWTGFCPKKPNRNRSVWTGFGSFFLNFGLVSFFDKNRTEPKMITPNFYGTKIF